MAWIYVILAGIIEIFWVIGLKHAEAPLEWAGVALLITISFVLLFRAYKDLPVGTVYAVFTGIGAGGIVLTEIFRFRRAILYRKSIINWFNLLRRNWFKTSNRRKRSEGGRIKWLGYF